MTKDKTAIIILQKCVIAFQNRPYQNSVSAWWFLHIWRPAKGFHVMTPRQYALVSTPNFFFNSPVLSLNRAWSPFERIMANPWLSTPLSYRIPDTFFSVSCNLARAFIRSLSSMRCQLFPPFWFERQNMSVQRPLAPFWGLHFVQWGNRHSGLNDS